MPKFNVIIPARMGSTRLANKMILDVGGLPLIVRTAKQALDSDASEVVVATDHEEIASICTRHNIKSILTSKQHQSGTQRLGEAVSILNLPSDRIVINVQGDEPLIDPQLINNLAHFTFNHRFRVSTVAHTVNDINEIFNPNIVKVVLGHNNQALYFSRAPIPYYRDGYQDTSGMTISDLMPVLRHVGIYAYTCEFIKYYNEVLTTSNLEQVEKLEQLRILYYGHQIGVLVSDLPSMRGVDTHEDLQHVNHHLFIKHHRRGK